MARYFILFAVILQATLIYANIDDDEPEIPLRHEVLKEKPDSVNIKDFKATDTEWIDLFTLPKNTIFPSSSAAKMAQVMNNPDKSTEEQVEDMKEIANQITMAIQNEIANLLTYALNDADKESNENCLRKKRSAENPLDSTQLVMRLLKHIKSNNEYQNIAIEKMMTAQEIADKYGIDFTPDTDIFSDLAVASTKQTEDLSSILQAAYNSQNATNQIEFVPINNEPVQSSADNNTYYSYTAEVNEKDIAAHLNTHPHFEYAPERLDSQLPVNRVHYEPLHSFSYHFNIPIETQIPPPVHQHAPVSYMPNIFEPVTFTPAPQYFPQYYPEPITTTTTIVLPIEELVEPEPELVGEVFEETVTSKVIVDRGDEPGSSTVNHVMTYTISEKSHFRTPQIENLPQQMQYYFFLM